jgi:hypothetical protein
MNMDDTIRSKIETGYISPAYVRQIADQRDRVKALLKRILGEPEIGVGNLHHHFTCNFHEPDCDCGVRQLEREIAKVLTE